MPDEFQGVPKKKPYKIGTVQTVDLATGEVVEEKKNAMMLLPCGPDVCQECGVDHPHGMPHNQQSMYYQYSFHAKYGRWPTWTDAMAHCAPAIRAAWRALLIEEIQKQNMPIPPDLASEGLPHAGR